VKSFQWDQDFETGISAVDTQHQHLVDLINTFGEKLSEDQVADADIAALFDSLTSYARYHFNDEQQLMLQTGVDPRHYHAHQANHDRFLDEVEAIHGDTSGDRTQTKRQLLNFLIQWLVFHILVTDKDMALQIRAIESGASPAEAFAQLSERRDSSTGPLVKALNSLFEVVSERNKALKELNRSLEQKVRVRTQALTDANAQLEALALTDMLTQLPNRRQAMRQLQTLWEEPDGLDGELVCIMIDADHFKEVNDTYGHDAGDDVLCRIATTLQHTMRTDDIVSRLGGDEFLAICPNTRLRGGLHIAGLLQQAVADLRVPTGDGVWIGSISVGVAVRDASMTAPEDLIKAADEGVYTAKQAGKNCVRTVQSAD
jgi:hemerythrin